MSRLNLGAITAYAIAKKHGFEGTEEEWLESLKGAAGSDLDVQIKGTSIVEEVDGKKVATIPIATSKALGVSKFGNGLYVAADGTVTPVSAPNDAILAKTNSYVQISPKNLDYAVKVGVTTNTISLTEEEKQSAQNWLGISGGTQLYKHELIINKTQDTYVELVFISTQSTPFTNVQTALESIFESDLECLVKGYTYNISVDIDGETYYKPMEIYIDFTKSIGSPPFDFCTTLEGGNEEQKFTDLSTIFPSDATIEEYTPIPL